MLETEFASRYASASVSQAAQRKWLLGPDPPRWTQHPWSAGIVVLGENSLVYVECDNLLDVASEIG